MSASLADAGFTLAQIHGYPGTRAEWDAYQARRHARERWETRQESRERLRRAKRAHGVIGGQLRPDAPAWQRGNRTLAPLYHARILRTMQNPRIRGQLATRPS